MLFVKKLCSFTIVAILCFTTCFFNIPVYAEIENDNSYSNLIDDYAYETASKYTCVKCTGVEGDLTISNRISEYYCNNYISNRYVYFVLNDGNIIAMLTVEKLENGYASSFRLVDFDELNYCYRNNIPICLLISDKNVFLCTDHSITLLIGSNLDEKNSLDNDYCYVRKFNKDVITDTSKVLQNEINRSVILDMHLCVNHVSNYGSNCWAATVAQNVNYMNGTYYTAYDIVNIYNNNPGTTTLGTIDGIIRAYSNCGVYVVSISSSITYSQVYGLLSNYRPLHIRINGIDSSGVYSNHGVTVDGITVVNYPYLFAVYDVVDPNSGCENFMIDYSSSYNNNYINYTPAWGGVYNFWINTIYKP